MKKWFENNKKTPQMRILLSRNRVIALFGVAIVLWSMVATLSIISIKTPSLSTSYYHANIQFRAGKVESYEDIFNQSLIHILEMYDRHPNWVWTLECQGLLIEMANQSFPQVFQLIKKQNLRGQLEIISPQYSHGLAVAYNYKDFSESIKYNKHLLEDVYGLKISNVIVLQEGQFLPAFPVLKSLGFDTIAISRDQLSYHNYYPQKPLLSYNFQGINAYVMPLPWLPLIEGGVFHHQLALSDSERVNTGGVEGPHEFNYNPDKMKQIELRHLELEKRNNIWYNMSDWVKRCISRGDIGVMSKYMPESHWTPNRHYGVTRWMGWDNGESDDGIVHARNYYTRNLIQNAEIMKDNAFKSGFINQSTYDKYNNWLLEASKHLWLAQVTDTTGVNPNDYEFEYAINNTYIAQNYSNNVINELRTLITQWKSEIQIHAFNRTIITDQSDFSYLNQKDSITLQLGGQDFIDSNVNCSLTPQNGNSILNSDNSDSSGLLLGNNCSADMLSYRNIINELYKKYGFILQIQYSNFNAAPFNITFSNITYHIPGYFGKYMEDNNEFSDRNDIELTKITIEFLGRFGEYITNTQDNMGERNTSSTDSILHGLRSDVHIQFLDDWNQLRYSPSLAENTSVQIKRDDYTPPSMENNDEYVLSLPISNGYVYNPHGNYSIISNNSIRHIAVRWDKEQIDFRETEFQYNARYEFFVVAAPYNASLLISNIINPYPITTLEAIS